MRIWLLLLMKVMGICDHWSTDPPGLHLSLPASIVSVHGPTRLYFEPLKLLKFYFIRIPIQFFTIMRIRIKLRKIMRIRIRNPDSLVRV
jgi:hypothetical protein